MKSAKTNPSFEPASEEAGFFMKKGAGITSTGKSYKSYQLMVLLFKSMVLRPLFDVSTLSSLPL